MLLSLLRVAGFLTACVAFCPSSVASSLPPPLLRDDQQGASSVTVGDEAVSSVDDAADTDSNHDHHHGCIHDSLELRRALHSLPLTPDPSPSSHELGDGGSVSEVFRVVPLSRRPPFRVLSSPPLDENDLVTVEGPDELFTTAVVRQTYGNADADDHAKNNVDENNDGDENKNRRNRRDGLGHEPIRIVFRTPDLEDGTKYCTSSSDVRSTVLWTSTYRCTAADVLTESKRQLLVGAVLPQAAADLSRILRVAPISGNLSAGNTSICSPFTVPQSDVSDGIPNADFVVYVGAAPTVGSVVAWAGSCGQDQNGRPILAGANFSPRYLNNATLKDFRKLVRTAVHELLHAIGFSSHFINSESFAVKDAIVSDTTRRGGQPVTLYKGPAAMKAFRNTYSCGGADGDGGGDPAAAAVDGIELEDDGGAGAASSHWERRFHKDDLMAGMVGDVMAYSAMTFAVLEDSGHYSIDYNATEEVLFMHNAGCGVFTNACNTTEGGRDRYYCFDTNSRNTYCTADDTAVGTCSVTNYASIPSWGQYFANPNLGGAAQWMNYCPIVSPADNRRCNRFDNALPNDTDVGNYYASDGRCFRTSPTLYRDRDGPDSGHARCFQTRCPDGGMRVEFRIGSSEWTACPLDGSGAEVAAPSPYVGNVTCPPAASFCSPSLSYRDATDAPPPSDDVTTEASSPTVAEGSPDFTGSSSARFLLHRSDITAFILFVFVGLSALL